MLGALDAELLLDLTLLALQPKGDLLGRLCLLVKDGLGLTSETLLLAIVSSLPLREVRRFASLVLGHLLMHGDRRLGKVSVSN